MENLIGVTVVVMLMAWGSWLLQRLPALGGRRKPDAGFKAGSRPARSGGNGKRAPEPEPTWLEVQVGESRLQVCPRAGQAQTFRLAVGCQSLDGPLPSLRINGRSAGWGEEIAVDRFTVRVVAVADPAGGPAGGGRP